MHWGLFTVFVVLAIVGKIFSLWAASVERKELGGNYDTYMMYASSLGPGAPANWQMGIATMLYVLAGFALIIAVGGRNS